MPTEENIRVAVRVRPFSDREKSRKAQLIVAMDGPVTAVADPSNPKAAPKKFTFDHSYWSHDGYKLAPDGYYEPDNKKYVDQKHVFRDLGIGVLTNAFEGYNCSLFAYGQTSSGKSYSIMGHGPNKGLVPRTCEELFLEMDKRKAGSARGQTNFEEIQARILPWILRMLSMILVMAKVTFSMLEIYNEHVRDLLNKKKTPPGGLVVRDSPGRGFYVEGISIVPVGSYQDIKLRMNEGDRQRTIAATKMNETSSRAHTIVTINFTQNSVKNRTSKRSSINLVDLAGSERAKQTESTGDRFEEAKNINKSLLTLGCVIAALCDKAKGKNTHAPFRDSVLTKLLKNALGGNSKTVMIAAISPDAENYEQTLSTLRYADRAKSIKTDAKVNQEATDKMIKELIAEKERLLRELESAKTKPAAGFTEEDINRLKEENKLELQRYREQMDDSESSWQKRLAEARQEMEEMQAREKQQEEEERKLPHLSNLNEDPALSGKLVHLLRPGKASVGNGKEGSSPTIRLNGPRIAKEHAELEIKKGGDIVLKPIKGLVLHNGQELTKPATLHHQDRIRAGSNNLFVFNNPGEAEALKKKGRQFREVTFEFAQNEIAKHSGLNIDDEHSVLKEEVMSIMQLVQDVNAMAEDMEKLAEFSIILVSAEARGLDSGRTEVYVKVQDLSNSNQYMWDKNRFLNRQVHMQELYQQFDESGEVPRIAKEKDPFWEPADTEVMIGVVSVPLNYLSHMVEFQEEPLTVVDYQAQRAGFLKVDLMPCSSSGNEDEDLMVDDPMDLVGKRMNFKIKVIQAMNLPERFIKSWCRYRFYQDTEYSITATIAGINPSYSHNRVVKISKDGVDHKLIDYLREKSLPIELWGRQGDNPAPGTLMATRQRKDQEKQRLSEELENWKAKAEKLQEKLDRINALVSKLPKGPECTKIKKIIQE